MSQLPGDILDGLRDRDTRKLISDLAHSAAGQDRDIVPEEWLTVLQEQRDGDEVSLNELQGRFNDWVRNYCGGMSNDQEQELHNIADALFEMSRFYLGDFGVALSKVENLGRRVKGDNDGTGCTARSIIPDQPDRP